MLLCSPMTPYPTNTTGVWTYRPQGYGKWGGKREMPTRTTSSNVSHRTDTSRSRTCIPSMSQICCEVFKTSPKRLHLMGQVGQAERSIPSIVCVSRCRVFSELLDFDRPAQSAISETLGQTSPGTCTRSTSLASLWSGSRVSNPVTLRS